MLSCKKASSLIDKKSAIGLSLVEKIQLAMHTSMCETCSAYEKQSKFMDSAIKNHLDAKYTSGNLPHKSLSERSKQKIINGLEKK